MVGYKLTESFPFVFASIATVFVATFVEDSSAAVALGIAEQHPDHPGKCYDSELKKAFPLGDAWQAFGQCARKSCFMMNEKLLFEIATCPTVGAAPPCKIQPSNNALSYPDCCPRVICPPINTPDFVEDNEILDGPIVDDVNVIPDHDMENHQDDLFMVSSNLNPITVSLDEASPALMDLFARHESASPNGGGRGDPGISSRREDLH